MRTDHHDMNKHGLVSYLLHMHTSLAHASAKDVALTDPSNSLAATA